MSPRRVAQRAALVVFGLALSLVAVEAVLQIGAWVMGATGRGRDAVGATDRARIVALGDSNTYGVMVGREDAYPQVLERLLNEDSERPVEVLNLGYPGTNSSQVRRQLPQVLAELDPELVIVMVGANDPWTSPVPITDAADERPLAMRLLEDYSRTYDLLYMLAAALGPDRVEASEAELLDGDRGGRGRIRFGATELEVGWTRAERPSGWRADLRANLEAIARACEEANVDLVVMAYQTQHGLYGRASDVIREAANANRIAAIDLYATFAKRCPDPACDRLLLSDGHPNVAGHELIARIVARELKRLFPSR